MVGNVNNIVESMFAADNVKNQQSTADGKAGNFSDYLDSMLLNSRLGLLTGGQNAGYSYMNGLSGLTGSIWQMASLKALRDELKKEEKAEDTEKSGKDESGAALGAEPKKKTDWATIRVIQHYRSPVRSDDSEKQGILV